MRRDAAAVDVGEHGLERLEVAVDVGDDRVQHHELRRAQRARDAVEHAVDEAARLLAAVALGDARSPRRARPAPACPARPSSSATADAQHRAIGGGQPRRAASARPPALIRASTSAAARSSAATTSSTSVALVVGQPLLVAPRAPTRRRSASPVDVGLVGDAERRPRARAGARVRAVGAHASVPLLRARSRAIVHRRQRDLGAAVAERAAAARVGLRGVVHREHAVQHRHAGVERHAHQSLRSPPRRPAGSARSRRGSRTPNASTASKRPSRAAQRHASGSSKLPGTHDHSSVVARRAPRPAQHSSAASTSRRT